MLEGYLQQHIGPKVSVFSGGWEPSGVDPQAIRVMAEDKVVIAGQTSNHFEDFRSYPIDRIILLDPRASSVLGQNFRKAEVKEFSLPEITGFGGAERMTAVRKLRDQLKKIAWELGREIAS